MVRYKYIRRWNTILKYKSHIKLQKSSNSLSTKKNHNNIINMNITIKARSLKYNQTKGNLALTKRKMKFKIADVTLRKK